MNSRAEVTTEYAEAYARASKKDKGRVLEAVAAATGWSRENSRRQLTAAAKTDASRVVARKPRAPKYSDDAHKVLQRVWTASGRQCGKYLVVAMRTLLNGLEGHDELVDWYSPAVRAELLAMSAASIDRYLATARHAEKVTGVLTTKPSLFLRSSIALCALGGEVESEPGFFEGETVVHCGPPCTGEFVCTVNLTDLHIGWVFTRSIPDDAYAKVLTALQAGVEEIPFEVTGLDFSNGTELLDNAVVQWAGERDISLTRSRQYKKNDQATGESKYNHLVRKYGFNYRYDTSEEMRVLNTLWRLVDDRLNYLIPTKKPVGWTTDRMGRRKRLYDKPQTPLSRLFLARVLSPAQEGELVTYRDSLNPAALTRQITDLQARLVVLAKKKTDQIRIAHIPSALPDICTGIHVRSALA